MVVITEIMADPTPPVMLNGEEYVELFNRSAFAVPVKEWSLEVNGRTRPVPDTLLDPGAFLLVKGVPLPNEGAQYG